MWLSIGNSVTVADIAGAAIPWVAILGFCGLLLKLRVSGDPALWKRIEALEARMEQQHKDFAKLLDDERKDCATKLARMEGRIRQMQQQHASLGNVSDNSVAGPLRVAFPPDRSDKDGDLVSKLDQVPSRKGRRG